MRDYNAGYEVNMKCKLNVI